MNAKELGDCLAEKLNEMNPAVAKVFNPHQTIELGLLQNILGMLGVIVQQNDILINHFCPPPKKDENNTEVRGKENS